MWGDDKSRMVALGICWALLFDTRGFISENQSFTCYAGDFIGRACKIDRMAGITLLIAKFRQEKVYSSKYEVYGY